MISSAGLERACDRRPRHTTAPKVRAERGAILVMVAAMMLGLTALSAFIVDYGILWTARRQIQNAADAAAMAAAISLAFDAPGQLDRAEANARTAVAQNRVWGAEAVADVSFPACPSNKVGTGTCVRVQAFRNQARGSPLPTVFGSLVGVAAQGVRATATAQVLFGSATDCVRPIAIPDKWAEFNNPAGPPGWDPLDTFQRYGGPGRTLLPSPDVYEPPAGPGANGTGYSRMAAGANPADYGWEVHLAPQQFLNLPVGNERFVPVRVTPGASGPLDMLRDMSSCAPTPIASGDVLEVEPADAEMPTSEGVGALIAQDPGAFWDAGMYGGRGGVSGGCMASGACTVSPRIVPIVAFDPDAWDSQPLNAPTQVAVVSRLIGLFVTRYDAPFVTGNLMGYPVVPRSTMTSDPQSSFVVSVALVR